MELQHQFQLRSTFSLRFVHFLGAATYVYNRIMKPDAALLKEAFTQDQYVPTPKGKKK